MRLIVHLIATALALLFVAQVVPGVTVSGFYTAVVVALLLGLLQVTIKPVLFLLTLPLNLLTLGFFSLVLNALMFWFLASFVEGFGVTGFLSAFFGALIVSIISSVVSKLL